MSYCSLTFLFFWLHSTDVDIPWMIDPDFVQSLLEFLDYLIIHFGSSLMNAIWTRYQDSLDVSARVMSSSEFTGRNSPLLSSLTWLTVDPKFIFSICAILKISSVTLQCEACEKGLMIFPVFLAIFEPFEVDLYAPDWRSFSDNTWISVMHGWLSGVWPKETWILGTFVWGTPSEESINL